MRGVLFFFAWVAFCNFAYGQLWKVTKHPNTRYYAISINGIDQSSYEYTEVSELSENKAYVAKGGLYAYVNNNLEEISPYVFVEASNFQNGYAIVGDSFGRSIINNKIQVIIPFIFKEVRRPVEGLVVVQSWQNMWGVYDIYGNVKLPFVYDIPPKILSRDRIIVRKDELYGIVNDCNEVEFPLGFQYISENGLGYKQGRYLRLFQPF